MENMFNENQEYKNPKVICIKTVKNTNIAERP